MLTIRYEPAGHVLVLGLDGELTGGSSSQTLREAIREATNSGQERLLLDLSGLERINSIGIGEIVQAFSALRRAGGDLKICVLSGPVHTILQQMELIPTVFEEFSDRESALKSFPLVEKEETGS